MGARVGAIQHSLDFYSGLYQSIYVSLNAHNLW
jgi:hypothetical protein